MIEDYYAKLQQDVTASMEFYCSDAFANDCLYEETGKLLLFETHEELDGQVREWFKRCPALDIKFRGEYLLLKAFDRAFHLRERKQQQKDKTTATTMTCIFKHPEKTNTICE